MFLRSDEIDLLEFCVTVAEDEVSDVSPEARRIIEKLRMFPCPYGNHKLQTLIVDQNFCPGCGTQIELPNKVCTPTAGDSRQK